MEALVSLLSQLDVERGQAVLECVISAKGVLAGLEAAAQLRTLHNGRDRAPCCPFDDQRWAGRTFLRLNAYRYSRTINKELAVIGRLRELQQRAIALIGSGILALLVGLANLLSSLTYYVLTDGDRA